MFDKNKLGMLMSDKKDKKSPVKLNSPQKGLVPFRNSDKSKPGDMTADVFMNMLSHSGDTGGATGGF